MGVDQVDLLTGLQPLLHHLGALFLDPLGFLILDDLDVRVLGDGVAEALVAVDLGLVGQDAAQFHHRAAVGQQLEGEFAGGAADGHVVAADEGRDAIGVDGAVEHDHRDARVTGLLDRRGQRV